MGLNIKRQIFEVTILNEHIFYMHFDLLNFSFHFCSGFLFGCKPQ